LGNLQKRSVDQLAEMRVFVRTIERGTFAAAAADLRLTPSAVSKLIRRLEARLGVRLINRTTRKLSLTAEGEAYFQSGRQLIAAVDGLEQEVAASASRPRGLLRINTPVSLGVHHLAPALIEFHRRYPDVRVNMSLTDRVVDFYAEQIDVAVRMGPLSDSRLMSRKIAEIEAVLSASPRYIDRFGMPRSAADLAQHRCIAFTAPGRGRWPFKTADGGMEHVEVAATFASDSLQCILQLALQGAGIARLADFLVADAIRAGDLVPVLVGQHVAERASVFAVFAPGTQKIPKVRVFLDFLVERFQHQPWRLGRGESEAYALRRPG
jgi:DNA-binding transcriptional LysR family regulator